MEKNGGQTGLSIEGQRLKRSIDLEISPTAHENIVCVGQNSLPQREVDRKKRGLSTEKNRFVGQRKRG